MFEFYSDENPLQAITGVDDIAIALSTLEQFNWDINVSFFREFFAVNDGSVSKVVLCQQQGGI